MIDSSFDLEDLSNIIRKAGRPVHINVLTRNAARAWLKIRAEERHYAPGDRYRPGETLLFEGQRATVESVQEGGNPLQGSFAILTLCLPDGDRRLMAAEIPDAPVNEQRLVTEERVEEVLREQQAEVRQALRSALSNDPRLVSCETSQGEFWCLEEMLPEVTAGELQEAVDFLPDELKGDEVVSHTIEGLARAVWGLEDDGSDDYALYTFTLRRALDACGDVVNMGDRWASAQAWQVFTSRPALTSPRISSDVEIPDGVEMASPSDVEREQRQEAAEEEEKEEEKAQAEDQETEDLEAWRADHPDYAVFTLRAHHYHEGWLPLSKSVRALFPPLGAGRQEVVFHHHFGDEPALFRAWVDRERNRIWVSRGMYETFRNHRIYPGARLRIVARNEREFDLATREADKAEPIRVWRMWLNEEGEIEYEDFEEPRRYEVDDDVYVADVRFEDREALLAQAEEVGNSVFGLMYKQAVERWEQGDREPLTVTADDLFEAIHFDEQGRMVSKATIAWELWKRLAFESLGGGCYRFRPRFGDQVRVIQSVPRPSSKEQPTPASTAAVQRTRTGQLIATDQVLPSPPFEEPQKPQEAVSSRADVAKEASSRQEEAGHQTLGARIDAEFQQIRALIRRSLVGKTIHTLTHRKPNRIVAADEGGLSVKARNTRKVLWRWIKGVYEALVRLGSIEQDDVQDGEYHNPGNYRSSFIFPLLSQFSHIDASTKPRIQLTYREPTGSVSLKSTTDDIPPADEVPAADQTQESLQRESRSPRTEVSGRRDAPPVSIGETVESAQEVEDVDTQEAFETLIGELQNALGDTQESIEDAVERSDFSTARDAAERGEKIQKQIDRLKALQQQWGNIAGSEAIAGGAKRAPRGASTPQKAYWVPILRALEEMGGSGRTSKVVDRVGRMMEDQFTKWDRQTLPSGDDIRWRNRAQWARNDMVKDGLLASDSPRGIWEITEKGRQVLREHRTS